MTALLTQNRKMKKSGGDKYAIFNWGIPAYKSTSGVKTCPLAGQCAKGCYAQAGAYVWSNVAQAFEARLELSQTDDFIPSLNKAIATKLKTATKRGQQLVIRIHDSGDFYSLEYTIKWFQVMQDNPTVIFYAYTKSLPMFNRLRKQGRIPENFVLVYSEGGLADNLIETGDRHSRVFSSKAELEAAGYDDASDDDKVAFLSESGKVGLVYHGVKSKKWSTAV